MRAERHPLFWALIPILLLAGCAGKPIKDGAPRGSAGIAQGLPTDPVPRWEPRSPYGNGPIYEVLGRRYAVMDSSYGYQERGVASWYGKKFHGRSTSSREPYNMHALTAAHKSLPLPTYVRVRNLRNDKSVIVRVNDRGPFVANRIIDLSYSAAQRLGMIREGTSLVEVTAISFDDPPLQLVVKESPAQEATEPMRQEPVRQEPVREDPERPVSTVSADKKESNVYVQVGAFGDVQNARRRFATLRDGGVGNAFVLEDTSRQPALYRIRIGPIADVDQYDLLVVKLQDLGIAETHLVTE